MESNFIFKRTRSNKYTTGVLEPLIKPFFDFVDSNKDLILSQNEEEISRKLKMYFQELRKFYGVYSYGTFKRIYVLISDSPEDVENEFMPGRGYLVQTDNTLKYLLMEFTLSDEMQKYCNVNKYKEENSVIPMPSVDKKVLVEMLRESIQMHYDNITDEIVTKYEQELESKYSQY